MDTLHSVLQSFRGDNRARRDHLDVFREFLHHLDRAARRRDPPRTMKAEKDKDRRGRK